MHFERQDTFGRRGADARVRGRARPRDGRRPGRRSRRHDRMTAALDGRGAGQLAASLRPARRRLGGARAWRRRGGRGHAARRGVRPRRPARVRVPADLRGDARRRAGGGRRAPRRRGWRRAAMRASSPPYAAHAAALAAGDADALLAVAEELAAIGAMPYAVDAAAQAAAALVRAGRHDAARRAAVRMRELHVPGQGTEPPEIEGLDAAASTLTSPRERDRHPRRRRALQRGDRRPPRALRAHRREPHLPRDAQARGQRPARPLTPA